jgi:hypothetical protein
MIYINNSDSKFKLFSPFHVKMKFEIFFLFSFIIALYFGIVHLNFELLIILGLLKIYDINFHLDKYLSSKGYESWLEVKHTKFVKNILNTKYVFYILSLVLVGLNIYNLVYTDSFIFSKIMNTFIVCFVIFFNYMFIIMNKKMCEI